MKNVSIVSVIVPVYNVEPYLEECLYSLELQTMAAIQVIMVNDGSTDGSAAILKKYADRDARFVYIEQSNQGLSAARNVGLLYATGEYIAFLDSDDWLLSTALQNLYDVALLCDADVVAGNVMSVNSDGRVVSWGRRGRDLLPIGVSMPGLEYFSKVMETGCYIVMVYNYLYKRAFLNRLNFRFENVIHEDELWTPKVLIAASSVIVADLDFYYYRQRANSLTVGSGSVFRVASILIIITGLLRYVENDLTDKRYVEVRECICVRILQLYHIACSLDIGNAAFFVKAGDILLLARQLDKWKSTALTLSQRILSQLRRFYNTLYI